MFSVGCRVHVRWDVLGRVLVCLGLDGLVYVMNLEGGLATLDPHRGIILGRLDVMTLSHFNFSLREDFPDSSAASYLE